MVKKIFLKLFVLISSTIFIFDQLLKYLVVKFNPNWTISLLNIHLSKNTGAGFGILQGKTLFLGIISLLVAFAIIIYYNKIPQKKVPQILFALFLGGVVGNLVDRLFRGFVIDFIDFVFWPSFNLADACISIASFGLIIYFWKK
jgi:signal peptidase II